MNNIEKYYNNILKKAENLLNEKKFDEAINILEDELETPYIPIDIYEKFEEKLLQIKYDKNYSNDNSSLNKINKGNFFKKISNKTSAIEIIYFFDKFKNSLTDNEKNSLYLLLRNEKIKNNIKILILENLFQIDNNKDFIFYNTNLKKEYSMNLNNIKFIESIDFFQNANEFLKKKIFKEPSLLEIAYTIIYSFYEYYFPNFIFEYSYKDFVYAIINSIENMLKNTKLIDGKAIIDIMKVIKNIG